MCIRSDIGLGHVGVDWDNRTKKKELYKIVGKGHKGWSTNVDDELNGKRAEHNVFIKRLKDKTETDREQLIEQARAVKAQVHALEHRFAALDADLLAHASLIPNDTHPEVPIGPEAAARVISTHGPPPLPATSTPACP